jgi:hypothetical protein
MKVSSKQGGVGGQLSPHHFSTRSEGSKHTLTTYKDCEHRVLVKDLHIFNHSHSSRSTLHFHTTDNPAPDHAFTSKLF